jgi:hypothetical protein
VRVIESVETNKLAQPIIIGIGSNVYCFCF